MNKLVEETFNDAINKDEIVCCVFSASWCAPCKTLHPVMEEAATQVPHPIYEVDIDDAIPTIEKLKIRGVPTVIVFKNGQEHKRAVGLVNKDDLFKMFE